MWAWVSSASLSPAIPVVVIPFMLCSISDIMVGTQDMYFGFNNDISTESYDPLLFLFNGNEEMYHYFELVSMGAFVVAGSIYTFNNVMYQYSYGIPTYYNTTGPSVFVGNTIIEGYTGLGVTLICAELGVDDEYAFYISASTGMII